jgi:hypothetical protein
VINVNRNHFSYSSKNDLNYSPEGYLYSYGFTEILKDGDEVGRIYVDFLSKKLENRHLTCFVCSCIQ